MHSFSPRRRNLLAGLLAAGLSLATMSLTAHAAGSDTLNIGYQKYGTLVLLKAQGTLEKKLAPLGVKVRWAEFPGGPQLLEGLNVGSVDLGVTGETPPIFAQAAGADLVYVGYEPPAPTGEAILVNKDSAIKSVKDLKGKRVALNKGSNVHYLLVRALEKAGLKYEDITPVFLPPADGRAAFQQGSVDAWVIWDPFLAAAEKQLAARVLSDGKGLVNNTQFYLARRSYVNTNPKVLRIVLDELARVDSWGKTHIPEVTEQLASQIGLDKEVTGKAAARLGYGVKALDSKTIAEQQRIADTFTNLKLIPKTLNVKEVVWQAH
ncbi:MAG: sulfonate ABC transporter substrate-binding protein [Aquitalea sp.]|nr:sulfonate ABC transporter substrate-binding protein [Aquitalea sp.]